MRDETDPHGSAPTEPVGDDSDAPDLYIFTPPILSSPPKSLRRPIGGNRNLLNYKTLAFCNWLENAEPEIKVGLVGSRTSAGRAVQSITSLAIPGDMGDIRSPVRSTVYETLTPGGGKDRDRRLLGVSIGRGRRGGRNEAVRCPAGFENGGRFATRGFGNCGRRLFDVPGSSGRPGNRIGTGLVGLLRADISAVGDGNYGGRSTQIQRNAQISRVGGANDTKFNQGITQAVAALSTPDVDGALLVRRDGQVLRAAVSPAVLANIPKNPDMQDGALVSAVTVAATMGNDEVPTIWRSGIRSVALALPGGGSIQINRTRDLNAGDKRRLGRLWGRTTNESDGEYDYGIRLRRLVEESNGSLSYEEKFPNVDKAGDTVTISETGDDKNQMSVLRWVHETYLAENAPGREKKRKAWNVVEVAGSDTSADNEKIDSVADAAKHLKNGGAVEDVPAEFLDSALSASKVFTATTVSSKVTLLERGNGEKWWRVKSEGSYSHLAERISADVNGALGLRPSTVKFIGSGADREVLVSHPETGEGRSRRLTVKDMPAQDLLRTVVADWLVDHRDRNPSSVLTVGRDGDSKLVPTGNAGSSLAGLSGDELNARRRLVLGDFLGQTFNKAAADRFRAQSVSQRKILMELYEDLMKRASNFNWDDYMSRLGLDGGLSNGEKAHVEIVKRLFERRLETLRASRQSFLSSTGIK